MKYAKAFIISLSIIFVNHSSAQILDSLISGTVSYKNTTHVYVKFSNTAGIQKGDTLFTKENETLIPALIVQYASTISCVSIPIAKQSFPIGFPIFGSIDKKITPLPTTIIKRDSVDRKIIPTLPEKTDKKISITPVGKKELINGRFSFSTNGEFTDIANEPFSRIRLSNSLNITNIQSSDFSLQSYVTYRRRYGIDLENSSFFNDFKVYTLALGYEPSSKHSLWLGRRIHPNMANMGALDGLQYERRFKDLSIGILGGFRPDLQNYGFNTNLWQSGLFINWSKNVKKLNFQSSIAFADQRSGKLVDRRFVYFQHSNTLIANVYFFFSSELDLFQRIQDVEHTQISLTSLYTSLRYKVNKKLSFQASYDNRRNVIYYETYRHLIDQLLDQETRQGYRLQGNYSFLKFLSVNASTFYRFQGKGTQPTLNYLVYLNFFNIPSTRISASLSANWLNTPYISGTVYSARMSRDFFKSKLNVEINGRWSDYSYSYSENTVRQTIVGASLSYQITRLTSILLNYETNVHEMKDYNRYYLTFQQRFKTKKSNRKK